MFINQSHSIHFNRVFERRYGSHKFASYLTANLVLTTLLEIATVLSLHYLGFDLHNGGHLPPGPWVIYNFLNFSWTFNEIMMVNIWFSHQQCTWTINHCTFMILIFFIYFRYGVIFPLFVSYFCDIPPVAQTSIIGIPITGKTLTYLLGLQLAWSSPASAISALCGLVCWQ